MKKPVVNAGTSLMPSSLSIGNRGAPAKKMTSKKCVLKDVSIQRPQHWNLDGCTVLYLSVGGSRGSPYGALPGLNSSDAIGLAAALVNATSLRTLSIPGLHGVYKMAAHPGIESTGMKAIAGLVYLVRVRSLFVSSIANIT